MSVSTAVEAQNSRPQPVQLMQQYRSDFTQVLPSHIKPETWFRVAQGALKKGKIDKRTGRYELELAAESNPGKFLAALLDAARQGLEPGTPEYYLTPRRVKGNLEILGITGYQGHIEMMYRAGAVASVVAECVYTGDHFEYEPGRDEHPAHRIDWDADDRGQLRLVYAYARMKDGATSRVVVLNKAAIREIKKNAQGSDSEYSPWQTSPESMWLKSAVRQLQKWVPTSAEYVRQQIRNQKEIDAPHTPEAPAPQQIPQGVDLETGEVVDAETYEDAEEVQS